LRYRAYSLEKTLLLALPTGRCPQWRLCILITESLCRRPWPDVAAAAIDGGADCLQLREKDSGGGGGGGGAGAAAELLRRATRLPPPPRPIAAITPHNLPPPADSGCRAVAVSSAVCSSANPRRTCELLRAALDSAPAPDQAPVRATDRF